MKDWVLGGCWHSETASAMWSSLHQLMLLHFLMHYQIQILRAMSMGLETMIYLWVGLLSRLVVHLYGCFIQWEFFSLLGRISSSGGSVAIC